jgi:serine/threonine-protein kinase RsbW
MGEPAWTWSLHKQIPSTTDAGHEVIEELLAALAQAGWDGSDFYHVQMAVEEAMVNAVLHGNQRAEDKSVEMEFKVSITDAYLRIKDEGSGFCPDTLPDPRADENLERLHGRGVMLMKVMMNRVTFNDIGNEVEMVKHRSLSKPKADGHSSRSDV